jgi:hypothetical protein
VEITIIAELSKINAMLLLFFFFFDIFVQQVWGFCIARRNEEMKWSCSVERFFGV